MKGWHPVVACYWEESEQGWGLRPDGMSLHLTTEDHKSYVERYWDGMPDKAPSCYSRPGGSPFMCLIDTKHFNAIKKSKDGIRTYENNPSWFKKSL